eukprot:XP_016656444.1 PREDICTED: zinc finger MYM-type protein 5-like [Acyrthosiphon pisum]
MSSKPMAFNKRGGQKITDFLSKRSKSSTEETDPTNPNIINSNTNVVQKEVTESDGQSNVKELSGELKDRDPALNVNAYNLIANNFGPYQPKDIQFPRVNGSSRSFRQDWYIKHEWLEYSPINDAAFCFYCRCFPPSNKYNELAYTLHGFKTWSRATKSFKDHENSASHKEASVKVSGFRSSKKVGNIASNGIAIRGHNESEDSLNKGNFLQERLSNLGTLQIEKKRNINIEEVIDEFNNNSSVNSRKLSLK